MTKRLQNLSDSDKIFLIGIVSNRDDYSRNLKLADLLNHMVKKRSDDLKNVYFVLTGGTFDRIFFGKRAKDGKPFLEDKVKEYLKQITIQLPDFEQGGVNLLSYLVVKKKIKIIWSFQSPDSSHHLIAQNKILRRMCDVHGVKRLVNEKSVTDWLDNQLKYDSETIQFHEIKKLTLPSGNEIELKDAQDSDMKFESDLRKRSPTPKVLSFVSPPKYGQRLYNYLDKNKEKLEAIKKIIVTDIDIPKNKHNLPFFPCEKVGRGGVIEIAMEILFGQVTDVVIYDEPVDSTNFDTDEHYQEISDKYQIITSVCKIRQDVNLIMSISQFEDWSRAVYSIEIPEEKIDSIHPQITIKINSNDPKTDKTILNKIQELVSESVENNIDYTIKVVQGCLEVTISFAIAIGAAFAIADRALSMTNKIINIYEKIKQLKNENPNHISISSEQEMCLTHIINCHMKEKKTIPKHCERIDKDGDCENWKIIDENDDEIPYKCCLDHKVTIIEKST